MIAVDGSLPRHWIKVAQPSGRIWFSGIPWSPLGRENLAECGAGPEADPHATDEAGVITEGAEASGCRIRFTAPYPITPQCLLSSPSGAGIQCRQLLLS